MAKGYGGFEALWPDLFWEAEDAPSEVPLMAKLAEVKEKVLAFNAAFPLPW